MPQNADWVWTLERRPIDIYNFGKMQRDFTYVDDVVSGVLACLNNSPADNNEIKAGGSLNPHAVYNIGYNRSEEIDVMIWIIEVACGNAAQRDLMPIQDGDVPATFADISAIQHDLGFQPTTTIADGVPRFVQWYKDYHGIA